MTGPPPIADVFFALELVLFSPKDSLSLGKKVFALDSISILDRQLLLEHHLLNFIEKIHDMDARMEARLEEDTDLTTCVLAPFETFGLEDVLLLLLLFERFYFSRDRSFRKIIPSSVLNATAEECTALVSLAAAARPSSRIVSCESQLFEDIDNNSYNSKKVSSIFFCVCHLIHHHHYHLPTTAPSSHLKITSALDAHQNCAPTVVTRTDHLSTCHTVTLLFVFCQKVFHSRGEKNNFERVSKRSLKAPTAIEFCVF